jgi:hypothetical protein
MRCIRATLVVLVVAIVLCRPATAAGAEAPGPDCGKGRVWFAPLEGCITPPVLRKKVEPPEDAPSLRYEAMLYVRVTAEGTVRDVQVLKAPLEGEPTEEGEAALAAFVEYVRQWLFAPGLDPDGKPVAMSLTLHVHMPAEDEE